MTSGVLYGSERRGLGKAWEKRHVIVCECNVTRKDKKSSNEFRDRLGLVSI